MTMTPKLGLAEKPVSSNNNLTQRRLLALTSGLMARFDGWIGQLTEEVLHSNKSKDFQPIKPHKLSKTKVHHQPGSYEEDVKWLLTGADSLQTLWQFFLQRLSHNTGIDLLCFSVLDERGDFIRVKYLYSSRAEIPALEHEPCITMNDRDNHFVSAYQRRDTTFCPTLKALGGDLEMLIEGHVSALEEDHLSDSAMHIFSVPFIAGNQTIALITLGFREMDTFSQAKLSYVYTLRDQIAQLVWNLVLNDRMKTHAQIDNLTGLLSYTSFQQVLEKELTQANQNLSSVTVMLMDINHIHDINAEYGHTVGDQAIRHAASTMKRLVRGMDTVARYGGDDLVVVLPETNEEEAAIMADRLMAGVKEHLPKNLQDLSVSIGYATFPDDTRKPDYVLKLAEQALHLAKFRGAKTGESIRIASHEMDQLNEKTVLEVFASHVAKKYTNIHMPSVYQELVAQIEKKPGEESLEIKTGTDDLMLETITSLAGALDAKDRYTRGHSQAVANYAVALAHALKMNPAEIEEVRLAAFLHDIGKIGIPESILCKEGPLTDREWEVMKKHPVIGAEQILAPVSSLRPIIPAVLHHHENWDGSGHPYGLKGEKIPIGARIVSIVDAFHALTSDRAYRRAMPVHEARTILEQGAGIKWDPYLIDIFFNMISSASPRGLKAGVSAMTEISLGEMAPQGIIQPVAMSDLPHLPGSQTGMAACGEALYPLDATLAETAMAMTAEDSPFTNSLRDRVMNSPLSLKAHVVNGNLLSLRSGF